VVKECKVFPCSAAVEMVRVLKIINIQTRIQIIAFFIRISSLCDAIAYHIFISFDDIVVSSYEKVDISAGEGI